MARPRSRAGRLFDQGDRAQIKRAHLARLRDGAVGGLSHRRRAVELLEGAEEAGLLLLLAPQSAQEPLRLHRPHHFGGERGQHLLIGGGERSVAIRDERTEDAFLAIPQWNAAEAVRGSRTFVMRQGWSVALE